MRLRLEWPWRARRYRIVPEESEQYWNIFFCFSSSCHAALSLFVRSMLTIQKKILKMIFNSPEFNRSIIVSRQTSMTKKMDQFLRHWIIGEGMFSWFNISPSSFPNRYCSLGWADRSTSLWICYSLWSACKVSCIQFYRIFFELYLWGFLLVVVQVCVNLIKSWEILSHEWKWSYS